MRLGQDQKLLLLPEHGAARLDLAVVQHLVVDGVVEEIEAH